MPDTIHNPFRVTSSAPARLRQAWSALGRAHWSKSARRSSSSMPGAAPCSGCINSGIPFCDITGHVFNAPSFRSRGRVSRSLADGLDRPAVG